jgi:hypothetical protein
VRSAYWVHLAESTSTKSTSIGSPAGRVGVLRHRRREHHGGVDASRATRLRPSAQAALAVVAQVSALPPAAARLRQRARADAAARHAGRRTGARTVSGAAVVRVVDEGAQVHLMPRHQVLEQVVRAHLVALVGRVRQAVHQVQQVGHRCRRRSAQAAHDERPQPVGHADGHAPPGLDQQLVLGVVGVVLRHGVALVQAVLVVQRRGLEAPVLLEGIGPVPCLLRP